MIALRRLHLTVATVVALTLLSLSACVPMATFNQHAYQQDVALKVRALNLMGKATEPFTKHADDVEELKLGVERAYEYANHLPNNDFTTKQWQIVMDESGHSLFGFLALWKRQGELDPVFVKEAKAIVSKQLDQIINLESGKLKSN